MSLDAALVKVGTASGEDSFFVRDLPHDAGSADWEELQRRFSLTEAEVVALKNIRCAAHKPSKEVTVVRTGTVRLSLKDRESRRKSDRHNDEDEDGRSRNELNVQFRTYADLEQAILTKREWNQALQYVDFEIKYTDGGTFLNAFPTDKEGLKNLPKEDIDIVVELNCKPFAKLALKPHFALRTIGMRYYSMYDTIAYLPRRKEMFPECSSISAEILDAETNKVLANLLEKRDLIYVRLARDCGTMREFISPILVGALRAVIAHNAKQFGEGRLSLVCDKRVIGKQAYGTVDYSLSLLAIDAVIVTEAKGEFQEHLYRGITQNLLEQSASQEFFMNTLINREAMKSDRKRKFDDAFGDFARTNTCGITTNGCEWVFSRIVHSRDEQSGETNTGVVLSDVMEIDLRNPDSSRLRTLLSRISRLVLTHARALLANEELLERRRKSFPHDEVHTTYTLLRYMHETAKEIEPILIQDDEDEEDELSIGDLVEEADYE